MNNIIFSYQCTSSQTVTVRIRNISNVSFRMATNKNDLFFEKNTYWFLLGLLDNRFAILENELEKVLLLENKNDNENVSLTLTNDYFEYN